MAYSKDAALEFWYEFDQAFLFSRTDEVNALFSDIYAPSFSLDALVDDVRDNIDSLPALVAGREV
ncbi:hypothetical protein MJ904_20445 [Massilia sp. MB5]|uniref:hypothetical protein n=1 Tax=Massilia sp. MB5 TaxID=2919578 RepID=UPI001F0F9B73|nr:hypothetical protein [Massilia sp. MB5]UMR29417.1 hypothetical protein MJ904_20445 [Massilia sp. MB5]